MTSSEEAPLTQTWGGFFIAVMLAVGVVAATYANGQHASVIPVTYTIQTAPSVMPAEAEQAVMSVKILSTVFRVASEKVLPSVAARSPPSDSAKTARARSQRFALEWYWCAGL
jgi:hypothetical protein